MGQVIYTPWCDEHGKVIDDGTVSRLGENTTAGPPRIRTCAGSGRTPLGLDVTIEDVSERDRRARAAGPDRGPPAQGRGRSGHRQPEVLPRHLREDRRRAGRHLAHRLHRRPRLRDLDALEPTRSRSGTRCATKGKAFDLHPAGMLALDVARIEAGLLLIDVDFNGSKKALIDDAALLALRDGALAPGRQLDKGRFVGQDALREEASPRPRARDRGPRARVDAGRGDLRAFGPARRRFRPRASRVAVPVYNDGEQVGKATSTTWSPTLKKMIALAHDRARRTSPSGTRLEMEVTVEAVRHRVPATVVKTPFFNPPRKTATPV